MTAKENAKELFNTFYEVKDPLNKYPMCFDTAKSCTLICVDEILNKCIKDIADIYYWKEVKEEIMKL